MKEITNRTSGPIQLVVKSVNKPSGFTTLVVYGRGKGKNTVTITDEQYTHQIGFLESERMISVRNVNS